ncbi:MAG: hypothetical protein ACP5QX_06055 [Caldisericaceae bacterium]
MNEDIKLFLKEFDKPIKGCGNFCFMSRGKEFQQDAINELTALKQKVISLKEKAIKNKDEDSANCALSLENIIDAMINELMMWIALKEDDPNKAWDYLIEAQSNAKTALKAHYIAIDLNMEKYSDKLYLLEKLLFPPQIFFSPGFIIIESKCSICGKEYGECEHIVGKAYMGQMCNRIITETDLKEVSVVEEPANKHARILTFTDNGVTRDFMTWKIIDGQKENNKDNT